MIDEGDDVADEVCWQVRRAVDAAQIEAVNLANLRNKLLRIVATDPGALLWSSAAKIKAIYD
jgi:hypothetical protein